MLRWVGKVFMLPKNLEPMIDQGNGDVVVGRQSNYATKKLRTND